MSDSTQAPEQAQPKPIVLEIRKLDKLETTNFRGFAKG
jgi:hypothetical protein